MSEKCTVIYNGSCPICSREIHMYRDRVAASGGALGFADLNEVDLAAYGLTPDMAARRLYVMRGGELISGVDAFLHLWRETPGFGGLARLIGLPGIRQVADAVYEGVLAPVLFAMHKRRQARGARNA